MIHKILAFTFQCWPTAFSLFILIGIVFGLMMGANPWLLQSVFDTIAELVAGEVIYQTAIVLIVLFVVFRIVMEIVTSLYYYYMNIIVTRMNGFMCKQVAKKAAKLDPVIFENPQILDDINKATAATNNVYWVGTMVTTTAIFHLPFLLLTAVYLYFLNPTLVLVIAFIFIPKMVGVIARAKLYTELEDKSAPLRRQFNFYGETMTDRQYFKETRLLGVFEFFKNKYLRTVELLNIQTWKADSKTATIDVAMSALTVIGYLGTLYLLFVSLQSGLITVGAFAAVFASVSTLIWRVNDLVTYNLSGISEEMGKIRYLMDFFQLPEKVGQEKSVNWQGDIEFKDVVFKYPNAKKASLNGLSLTIKAGETVAIVGENGAGKSTFTNLLMGVYEPASGEITVDGKPIKNIKPQQLFAGVSAVFQKYQRYQLMLKENVQISDVGADDDIQPVMKEAGVEWESRSYPDGVDTVLSREFDGVDLSGGQWQRISIARGLYRQHDLIVLDEPTAAIDPLEESRLYEKFAEISKDKTAVIVTHRLGSAQIADKIVVLDDGKVGEVGTHQELIESKGHYAKMYESQASWYMS